MCLLIAPSLPIFNNFRTGEWIFMRFDNGRVLLKLVNTSQLWLTLNNNKHFTGRPTCFSVHRSESEQNIQATLVTMVIWGTPCHLTTLMCLVQWSKMKLRQTRSNSGKCARSVTSCTHFLNFSIIYTSIHMCTSVV